MGFADGYRKQELHEEGILARRQQLKTEQENRAIALSQSGYTPDGQGGIGIVEGGAADQQQQQLQMQAQQLKRLQDKIANTDTRDTIKKSIRENDFTVFNKLFTDHPQVKKVVADMLGVDPNSDIQVGNIDFSRNSEVLGETIEDAMFENPSLKEAIDKRYATVTVNGKETVVDTLDFVAGTGYLNKANNDKSAIDEYNTLMNNFEQVKKGTLDDQAQQNADTAQKKVETESEKVTASIAAEKIKAVRLQKEHEAQTKQFAKTHGLEEKEFKQKVVEFAKTFERDEKKAIADAERFAKEHKLDVDQYTFDVKKQAENYQIEERKIYDARQKQKDDSTLAKDKLELERDKFEREKLVPKNATKTQRDLAAAEVHTQDLIKTFGGPDEFFNTDFGNKDNYLKAYKMVAQIESLQGIKLSSTDKKELNHIRQLIALGDPTSKLSTRDTGLVDKFLGGINKYLTDEVGGIKAKSAYAAFRNVVRHALYGSALTEVEVKSFREAFGDLGQKLGPVLQQFRTNLTQVKAKLESISRNSNPYTMKVRMGVDQDKLDSIIASFDERIAHINGLQYVDKDNQKPLDKKPVNQKKSLSDIFN